MSKGVKEYTKYQLYGHHNYTLMKSASSSKPRKATATFAKLNFIVSTLIGILFSVIIQFILKTQTPCKILNQIQRVYQNHVLAGNSLLMPDTVAMDSKGLLTLQSRDKDLVLIGVMTAKKFLDTRVIAGHNTWAKTIPGKVIYFCSDVDDDTDDNSTGHTNDSLDSIIITKRDFNFKPKRLSAGNQKSSKQDGDEEPLIVSLPGVSDAYPPQKKSFMMFKFMYDNYADDFKWFVRADDDVYIKGHNLAKLLRSLDPNEPYFIGQAGQGMKEEMGMLHLNYDENFCMGGPSMILSADTLKKMAPHIKYCLNHLYTFHEDIEIGRCIKTFAGIPCTWAYESQTVFLHYYHGSIWIRNNTDKNKKAFDKAITLHPFKNHQGFYDAQAYFLTQKIRKFRNLHNQLLIQRGKLRGGEKPVMEPMLPGDVTLPYDYQNQKFAYYFVYKNYILMSQEKNNPRQLVGRNIRNLLLEMSTDIKQYLNKLTKNQNVFLTKSDINWFYMSMDNPLGNDIYVCLELSYRRRDKNVINVVKNAKFRITRPYTNLLFKEYDSSIIMFPAIKNSNENPAKTVGGGAIIPPPLLSNHINANKVMDEVVADMTHNTKRRINFIVPLMGRISIFERFLRNFEIVCLQKSESVSLTIVIFNGDETMSPKIIESSIHDNNAINNNNNNNSYNPLIEILLKQYPQYRNLVKVLIVKGEFSRGLALELGASQYRDEDLLFFIDIDMVFNVDVLHRIRFFTNYKRSMYYPIVFSQFNPEYMNGQKFHSFLNNNATFMGGTAENYTMGAAIAVGNSFNFPDITTNEGYWRSYGFGIASVYKKDFDSVGGFDMSIFGWGKEDVDLYDKCISKKYQIYHAPDPGLIHIFHGSQCADDLKNDQYIMCLKSKANNLAANKNLYLNMN